MQSRLTRPLLTLWYETSIMNMYAGAIGNFPSCTNKLTAQCVTLFLHRKKNVRSFPSLKAHRAALIAASLALSQTPVFTLRDHGYGACVSRGVPVYVPAVKPVPNFTAWRQRHMCVNNLPKVVTRQCPGAESNLCSWVTSRLQVRHITVRLPNHQTCYIHLSQ